VSDNTYQSKDPALLFYPGDWTQGTLLFTREQKGAYLDLLVTQFNNGHLSLDDIRQVLGPDFDKMWECRLSRKFKTDVNGLFFNERWEYEMLRRKKFTQSRKNNLSSSRVVIDDLPGEEGVKEPKTKKTFVPPTEDEVVSYFTLSGYSAVTARRAFRYYNQQEWKDSRDHPVLNWKGKMIAVWFKPENQEAGQAKLPEDVNAKTLARIRNMKGAKDGAAK